MLSYEEGAAAIVEAATGRYAEYFGRDFPFYEYVEMTAADGFDVSLKGAQKLAAFIDQRITDDDPVPIPDDYDKRIY